jgi:hypothetical protein
LGHVAGSDHVEQDALIRLAGDDDFSGIRFAEQEAAEAKVDIAFGLFAFSVAVEAVGFENGPDIAFEMEAGGGGDAFVSRDGEADQDEGGGPEEEKTAGGTPAATDARFQRSPWINNDLYEVYEPRGIPGGETPPSTAGGTPAATESHFLRMNADRGLGTVRQGHGTCPAGWQFAAGKAKGANALDPTIRPKSCRYPHVS